MPGQDPDSWMWERAREIIEQAEKLQRHIFEVRRARYLQPTWEPPVDVFETASQLWILVALPGVEEARIEVAVDGGLLMVTGERSLPVQCREADVHRLEIPYGRFEREIELPAGRFEVEQRSLEHGCLLLCLRRL